MPAVIRSGDTASGHTDIEGNAVVGTVDDDTCSVNLRNGGKRVATGATYVDFPSHAHALDEGTPIDFRSHSVLITATGKHRNGGNNIAVDGDVVAVADEAGPNATLDATTEDLLCTT